MTCETARERLDDYVDGELEASALHELELHLASCPSCREEERALRALLARAAELPRTMAPGRDLWPGVAEAIRKGKHGRVLGFERRPMLFTGLLAAAAALVVALVIPRQGEHPGTALPTATFAPTLVTATPQTDLREAEADYDRATKALLDTLEGRRDRLAPETLKGVEQNLAVIDEALREVRAALHQEPGNPELFRMLAATHRKKVEVLRRVVRLSTSRL